MILFTLSLILVSASYLWWCKVSTKESYAKYHIRNRNLTLVISALDLICIVYGAVLKVLC